MRTQKFTASQLKCNFCLDWYTVGCNLQPPSGINICDKCFKRARSAASYKVRNPQNLQLYQLQLRKTGLLSDEAQSISNQSIAELVQFYEKRGPKEKEAVQSVTNNLNDLNCLSNELYSCTEDIRQFLHGIYRKEIERVEALWESALGELDAATKQIDKERQKMKQSLSTYTYNFSIDSEGIANKESFLSRLGEIKRDAEKIMRLDAGSLQDLFSKNNEMFYSSGFSLFDVNYPARLNTLGSECSLFELPSEYAKLEQSIALHRELSTSPQDGLTQANQNIPASALMPPKPPKHQQHKSQTQQGAELDKENYLLESFLPLARMRSDSKTKDNSSSNRKAVGGGVPTRTISSFGRTNRKPLPPNIEKIAYEQIDFKNFTKWPREKILELLRSKSKDYLPKGYKSGDQKPQVMRSYPEKVMTSSICEALDRTFSCGNIIELTGYDTSTIEFLSYLRMLKWTDRTEIAKFVSVGLTDENFNLLLCMVEQHKSVQTLVVSSNNLTQASLEMLLNFCKQHNQLRTVYLGRNHINPFRGKAPTQMLRALGVTVYT